MGGWWGIEMSNNSQNCYLGKKHQTDNVEVGEAGMYCPSEEKHSAHYTQLCIHVRTWTRAHAHIHTSLSTHIPTI